MKKILTKLLQEDGDLKILFTKLYFDLKLERAIRDLSINEKFIPDIVPVPTSEQVSNLQKKLVEKELTFSNEEIFTFTEDWGKKSFNWLIKDS